MVCSFFRWCFQTSTGPALSHVLCKALTGTYQRLSLMLVSGATFPQKPITHASKLYHSHPEAAEIAADSMMKLSGIPHFSWKQSMTNSPPNTHLKRKKKKGKKEKQKYLSSPQHNETLSTPLTKIQFVYRYKLKRVEKVMLVPRLPAVRVEVVTPLPRLCRAAMTFYLHLGSLHW